MGVGLRLNLLDRMDVTLEVTFRETLGQRHI